jgi:tetratricopeptide (TPR) repeat protein
MERYITLSAAIFCAISLYAQEPDFKAEFTAGNFQKSADIIEKKLDDIYNKRTDKKKVPTGFITLKVDTRDSNLMEVFRKRKAEGFFIEDVPEISELHLYAARSYTKLNKPDYALNHYIQSMRFKHLVPDTDHEIAWEISQVHKGAGNFNAYTEYLESAYTMNPAKAEYSLELGRALYPTAQKLKSIYHLRRYLDAKPERDEPQLLIMIASLYEETGKHLETKKYYLEYLKEKPDDANIRYALGVNSFFRTGDLDLAISSFQKALEILPENDIFRRSKSHEYIADISMKNLKFDEAIRNYSETIKYQEKILKLVEDKRAEMKEIERKINEKKSILLREQNFDEYEEYEILRDELAMIETDVKTIEFEYKKLNTGKVRWNIAGCYERLEKYEDAIAWYRECLKFHYNPNAARDNIIKLQLKIKRGY